MNDPKTTISGPSSARKRNAIFAFRWRADHSPILTVGSFTILRGFGPVLLKKLYFCEFPGRFRTPYPPLWIRTCNISSPIREEYT